VTPEASLFPVFLKLRHRRVVVVGGGNVAASRVEALRTAGADVTVVAPFISPAIRASGVTLVSRGFTPTDLDGAWLVVAAATAAVNRDVRAAAEARRLFVNAVDDPDTATAYTGGVLRRGAVTIAVSTEGAAPALAGLFREGLEAVMPEDVETWVREARALRRRQRAEGVPLAARRPLLLDALNALYAERAPVEERRKAGA
jgi:uroporphyrin-III C-methyltransferase/precorrin-2 dehydrogenase/sirohydrochlorin ferrochelatase